MVPTHRTSPFSTVWRLFLARFPLDLLLLAPELMTDSSLPIDPTQLNQPLAPELLAPAGDWDCVTAAIENGADAVYFGLDSGFNARARAKNFSLDNVDELMATLHRRGVKGYVTLNTLVFHGELPRLATAIERIARAGVDAILVQDLGVAKLAKQICPELDVHASTQMTLTCAETIQAATDLGLSRVVLARELSIREIKQIAHHTAMPLETFIHGALCVAYSGQCLTSESLGGRSANRGQCAQACRLPYELIVDGEDRPLGDVRYLLSPQDLAGYALIPELIEAGICSLKIEGRLKTPEYVANITAHYRRAIDNAMAGRPLDISLNDVREMEMSFSRGFSPGWLEGNDHKRLVPGTESAKRGVLVGEVLSTGGGRVIVQLQGPIARGDGVAFDGDRAGGHQQGGRIYGIWVKGISVDGQVDSGEVELEFGREAINTLKIAAGSRVWKSDDPALNKRLRKSFTSADPQRRSLVDFVVIAVTGEPLQITATCGSVSVEAAADTPLQGARNRPATAQSIEEQLSRLGGTAFDVGSIRCEIAGEPMVPASVLNSVRRELMERLSDQMAASPARTIQSDALDKLLHLSQCDNRPVANQVTSQSDRKPELRVLCRSLEQVKAVAEMGVRRIYVDFHDIRQYRDAVAIAHSQGTELFIASVRIQKPGERGLMKVLTRHEADGFLARNLAALDYFHAAGLAVVGDFSLNVVNPISADWLLQRGCQQVTPSYDLNREQLLELLDAMPPALVEVVIHQHMPMFHMEHCVFCSVLSPGTNKTNCGRPCDRHVVQLRDRVAMEHPLHADVACRNTLYNAVPQSGAEAYEEMESRGIGAVRVELLEQSPGELRNVVRAYQDLIAGRINGSEVWKILKAANRVGVTRGTLEAARNPLTII